MKVSVALTILTHLLASGYALDSIVGVASKDQELYKPDSNEKWRCLNHPEIELDFSQINDDYCDCPDGSDEPGTAACPNGVFYCENEGHVPSYIKSSLVNDGRCDYELCCDGSDEWNTPIECPNRCEEIGNAYREELALKEKIYQVGSGKVESILKHAKKLKSDLEEKLKAEEGILKFVSRELESLKDKLAKMELDGSLKKELKDDIQTHLTNLQNSVSSGFNEFISNDFNLIQLKEISNELLDTFNPNLNDIAVKKVVENYQTHLTKYQDSYKDDINYRDASFNFINELTSNDYHSLFPKLKGMSQDYLLFLNSNKKNIEKYLDLEQNLQYLIDNYNPNFNDPNVKKAVQSFQDFLTNKKESLVESLEPIDLQTNKIRELLEELGSKVHAEIEPIKNKSSILDDLKIKFRGLINEFLGVQEKKPSKANLYNTDGTDTDADGLLKELQKNKDDKEKEIRALKEELSKDFGPDDILRSFKDVTISGRIGEYDYELSVIGDVKQKGHGDSRIGSYKRYELNDIDDKTQQFVLYYTEGQKCWNGPKRSGVVYIECGENNEIISVTEPEKCEYHFRVKSPIGCKLRKPLAV